MQYYLKYYREVFFLLGDSKKKLPWMVFIFFLSSIFDVVGIGLILPYTSLIINPDSLYDTSIQELIVFFGLPSDAESLLRVLGIILVLVFVVKSIVAILINKIIVHFCFQQSLKLRSSLVEKYQNMPYVSYTQRNSSEYIYHAYQLTNQFSQTMLLSILRIISESIIGIAILLVLAWRDLTSLAFLVTLLGMVFFIYDRQFRHKIQKLGHMVNIYENKIIQGIQESISGLKELRILGKEGYFLGIIKENSKGYSSAGEKHLVYTSIPRYLLELIIVIFVVLTVFVSIESKENIDDLIPTLSMFGIAAMRIIPSASQVIDGISTLRFGRNSVSLLYSDLSESSSQLTSKGDIATESLDLFESLKLERVSFAYPNMDKPSLDNISLNIQAGDVIGFIGQSGSGKTTLIDLFLGLLEPQTGQLLYNGKAMNDYLGKWRSQVAYLPQQILIIDSSLKKNIALGLNDSQINQARVIQALDKAKLTNLVSNLPEGIDTLLGEGGIRLSGGQRQRVALARAFYYDRNILIMDESTSALDSETEHEIIEEIRQLKGKMTIIIISHRHTTLQYCDRIYQLDRGRLIKQLNYQELL
jgi:ABC-type bacteriocin/lantibiotic exporter with double-glycine peptidase domain